MVTWFNKWLFLFLPMLWVGGTAHTGKPDAHPFYVGVTEINHNAAEKTLEISCKMFVDDMEAALKQNFRTLVDLSNAAQEERSGNFVNQYIQRHLQVLVNGRAVPLKFIGFEKDSESLYCYLEAGGIAAVKKIEVVNNLLYDYTHDQINIMHVTVGGKRQSSKLNYPAQRASFDF